MSLLAIFGFSLFFAPDISIEDGISEISGHRFGPNVIYMERIQDHYYLAIQDIKECDDTSIAYSKHISYLLVVQINKEINYSELQPEEFFKSIDMTKYSQAQNSLRPVCKSISSVSSSSGFIMPGSELYFK